MRVARWVREQLKDDILMCAGSKHKPKARKIGITNWLRDFFTKPAFDKMKNVCSSFIVGTKYDHLVHTRLLSLDLFNQGGKCFLNAFTLGLNNVLYIWLVWGLSCEDWILHCKGDTF